MDKQSANAALREAMAMIYPKIEAFYGYIYGKHDDLHRARGMKVFVQ